MEERGKIHHIPIGIIDWRQVKPGSMPLFVALIAYLELRECIDLYRKTGLASILLGVLVVVGWYAVVMGGSDWAPGGISVKSYFSR